MTHVKKATAWAPGNISCIFQICRGKGPSTIGSRGLGFTVNRGAKVTLSEAKSTAVFYNKKKIIIPTVLLVIKKLTKKNISVKISSELPLGVGFGMSGASALATSYALNKLLRLGKGKKELAMAAHCAEVEAGTGLGDVVNQFYGGLLVKLEPSWRFEVMRPRAAQWEVYCRQYGRISTKSIISNPRKEKKINGAAQEPLEKLGAMLIAGKTLSFQDIISLSKEFAVKSGLLGDRRVKAAIKSIEKRGGHASMIMLGNAVFADIPFPGSIKLRMSKAGAQ